MPLEDFEAISRFTREVGDSTRNIADFTNALERMNVELDKVDKSIPQRFAQFNKSIGSSRRSAAALNRILDTTGTRLSALDKALPQRLTAFNQQLSSSRTSASSLNKILSTTQSRLGGIDAAIPQNISKFTSQVEASRRSTDTLNKSLATLKRRYDSVDQSAPKSLPSSQSGQSSGRGSIEGLAVGATALVGLTAATQGLVVAQIEAAVQLERQKVSLEAITGSASAAEEQYQRLVEAARLPGINISQALSSSAQLQAVGLSGERAAEAISAIGNALAVSGQSSQELGEIINALTQLKGEGSILQEDISRITARIPSLIPLLEQTYGGTRAKQIRAFYEAQGQGAQAAAMFIPDLITELQKITPAGETAGNALENLSDTFGRVQAVIGTALLPSVVNITKGIEGFLSAIEKSSPATQKWIAVGGVFAATLFTVAAGGTAVAVAIGLIATTLGAAAGPIGIAIGALALLTAGVVALTVATSDVEKELPNIDEALENNTAIIKANADAIEARDRASQKSTEKALEQDIAKDTEALELVNERLAELYARRAQLQKDRGSPVVFAPGRLQEINKELEEVEGNITKTEAASKKAQDGIANHKRN